MNCDTNLVLLLRSKVNLLQKLTIDAEIFFPNQYKTQFSPLSVLSIMFNNVSSMGYPLTFWYSVV